MKRILVIGTTGSGKSTLAHQLAAKLALKYIELDSLHHLPDWQERPRDDFRRLAAEIVGGEQWVLDGNYFDRAGDITWPRADTVIWLDMPFFRNFWALFTRTLRRIRTGELICNGNREPFAKQFASGDSILWWFLKTWHKNRRKYGTIFDSPQAYPHIKFICLTSYAESAGFVESMT